MQRRAHGRDQRLASRGRLLLDSVSISRKPLKNILDTIGVLKLKVIHSWPWGKSIADKTIKNIFRAPFPGGPGTGQLALPNVPSRASFSLKTARAAAGEVPR